MIQNGQIHPEILPELKIIPVEDFTESRKT